MNKDPGSHARRVVCMLRHKLCSDGPTRTSKLVRRFISARRDPASQAALRLEATPRSRTLLQACRALPWPKNVKQSKPNVEVQDTKLMSRCIAASRNSGWVGSKPTNKVEGHKATSKQQRAYILPVLPYTRHRSITLAESADAGKSSSPKEAFEWSTMYDQAVTSSSPKQKRRHAWINKLTLRYV